MIDSLPAMTVEELASLMDIYWDGTYTPDTPDSDEEAHWIAAELAKAPDDRRTYGWRLRELDA